MNNRPAIALIVAHDLNLAIGWNGKMPWHLSADLRRFKQITYGHPVIMGRRTFESIPGGALPGRRNIVISRTAEFHPQGAEKATSPEEALQLCAGNSVVFIIGGATLYEAFIEQADLLYITLIEAEFEADTWFPEYHPNDYTIVEETTIIDDEKFSFPYRFLHLERKTTRDIHIPNTNI